MPNLRIRPAAASGHVHHVTPESAGWSHVGFDLHKLPNAGDIARGGGDDREACIVLISGRAAIDVDGQTFLAGERMSPFEGPPHSVYAPAGATWHIEALTELEVAVCSAPGVPGAPPPRPVGPNDAPTLTPGKGTNTRYPTNILPESAAGTPRAIRRTSTTATRCPRRACSRKPTTTGSRGPRASVSSASIPTTARSTRPC